MRSLSAAQEAHAAQENTTFATCLKLTFPDASVVGYTNHDRNLVVSGVTYSASTGYTPTDITNTDMMNVNNMDIVGMVITGGVTEGDIKAGKYDGAAVEIFIINWTDVSEGPILMHRGTIGQITRDDNMFTAELRGLKQFIQQNITESFATTCRATLGDSRCKIRLAPDDWAAATAYTVREAAEGGSGSVVAPTTQNRRHFKCTIAGTSHATTEPTWDTTIGNTTADNTVTWETIQALSLNGTVTGVTDLANFTDSSMTEADGFWALGKVTWLTGNNATRSMEVKESTLTGGAIELYLPMPDTIQVGDTFTIFAGCARRLAEDCLAKYDNVNNARMEPYIPGLDALVTNET